MSTKIKKLVSKWAAKNAPDGRIKLAMRVGISHSTMNRLCTGKGKIDLVTALRLAKELGVKVEDLAK